MILWQAKINPHQEKNQQLVGSEAFTCFSAIVTTK